jgi:hypothetical protein
MLRRLTSNRIFQLPTSSFLKTEGHVFSNLMYCDKQVKDNLKYRGALGIPNFERDGPLGTPKEIDFFLWGVPLFLNVDSENALGSPVDPHTTALANCVGV